MMNQVELSITRRFPFTTGYEFGTVGAYEQLTGRAHFAVDPSVTQQGSTDIRSGDRRFAGYFSILKPLDPRRGDRRILFDYGNRNRGNKRVLQFYASNDPRTLAHAANWGPPPP